MHATGASLLEERSIYPLKTTAARKLDTLMSKLFPLSSEREIRSSEAKGTPHHLTRREASTPVFGLLIICPYYSLNSLAFSASGRYCPCHEKVD